MQLLSEALTIVCLVAIAVAAVALALAIVAICRQRRLEAKYSRLFGHVEGGNVRDALEGYAAQVRQALGETSQALAEVHAVGAQVTGCVQRSGVVRFNPFDDTGGDQSFALALADAEGNGVVLSSLHARGLTRVYAKPLAGWASTYQLTEEENQAIQRARAVGTDGQ